MRRPSMTDEQVEQEIARLKDSDDVKLALRYRNYQMKRRQYMYSLRDLEKRGKALKDAGLTMENFYDVLEEMESEEKE